MGVKLLCVCGVTVGVRMCHGCARLGFTAPRRGRPKYSIGIRELGGVRQRQYIAGAFPRR